jgi:aminoglycoside phosphotransferase (APT) family kinase protein
LTARLTGGRGALYRFVSGEPAAPLVDATTGLLERLGETAAEIHSLTPRLTVEIALGRTRQVRRLRNLDETLAALPRLGGARATRLMDAVGAYLGGMRAQLARLLYLHQRVPEERSHLVLIHGDLTGNNVMVEGTSPLGVLDWDEAALDVPETEFGLVLLDGGKAVLRKVLTAYAAAGGYADLELERIELAALQRHLHDLAVRFERALGSDMKLAAGAVADVADWGVRRTVRLQT